MDPLQAAAAGWAACHQVFTLYSEAALCRTVHQQCESEPLITAYLSSQVHTPRRPYTGTDTTLTYKLQAMPGCHTRPGRDDACWYMSGVYTLPRITSYIYSCED